MLAELAKDRGVLWHPAAAYDVVVGFRNLGVIECMGEGLPSVVTGLHRIKSRLEASNEHALGVMQHGSPVDLNVDPAVLVECVLDEAVKEQRVQAWSPYVSGVDIDPADGGDITICT